MVLVGFGATMLAPFLTDPRFEIVNKSQTAVYVTAYWKDKSMEFGLIQPSVTFEFSVDDEASMKFLGRYPNGREIHSEEIYFTSGTGVVVVITEQSIKLKYDHD
ncbi:MAG: hypothetical protein ABW088_14165 [Sedimenticola sp.]